MSRNFHEQLAAGDVPMPTDRSTGLVFAAVALIVAVLWRKTTGVLYPALAVSAAFAATSLVAPRLLHPLTVAWFRFGLVLHKVMSPLVMLVMFVVAIVPFGLLMQLSRDPLRKRRQPEAKSYWITPDAAASERPASMKNQF